MRKIVIAAVLACTPALVQANWHYPRAHARAWSWYYPPVYIPPPVYYVVPMYDPCAPAAVNVPPADAQPPRPMPEKKSSVPTPYSPIAPAGGEERQPRLESPPLPMPTIPESSTSKYRPNPETKVVQMEGAPPAGGYYHVGIFNHSDRDVTLTVHGSTITLPKRTTITATVPRTFTWSIDNGTAESVTLTGRGAEITIR